MDNVKYFSDLFTPIPDYRKIVLLMFLIKNDVDLLTECGLLEDDINRYCRKLKNILEEQLEKYLGFFENEEKSIIERILNK